MYEITVISEFTAAHALRLDDGSLEPSHDHIWPVQVTVAAERLDTVETVMDFHELERMVEQLIRPFDQSNLNEQAPFAGNGQSSGNLAMNPSAERVAWWIGTEVGKQLPGRVRLQSVRVGEAEGCVATYRPSPGDAAESSA